MTMETSRRSVLKLFGVTAAAATTTTAVVAPLVSNTFAEKAYVDPFIVIGDVPKGVLYNWKRVFIDSQEPDMNNLIEMVGNGWRPVPSSRHPKMASEQGYWIEHGGLVLMEKAKV